MPPKTRVRRQDSVLTAAEPDVDPNIVLSIASERVVFLAVVDFCQKQTRRPFNDFVKHVLGVTMSPVQAEVAGFLFDGRVPTTNIGAVFGGIAEKPSKSALKTALAVCGRGSGKTKILLAARAIHLALTADLSPVSVGESALVAIVAPSESHGKHTLMFVKGFFLENPILAKVCKCEITANVVRLTRPTDGREVTIEVRAASSGGKAVRGPSLAGVLMDEAAFFMGEGFVVNDQEIYDAATPRMLPDSQIVLATSPWAQTGLVWDLYKENFGKPKSAVVVKAPSLLMHPTAELEVAYQNMLAKDPDNCAREYDANFLSADAERFFSDAAIDQSIDTTLTGQDFVKTGERVLFGADFGFQSDSSALFGFADRGDKYVTVSLVERRPTSAEPLKPSEVVAEFAQEIKRCGSHFVTADAWYREAIQEHLSKDGLGLLPAPVPPASVFITARLLMNQGLLKIPNNPRLLAQLRRVKSTIKPGGVVTIHQPKVRDGGHGDIVSAMVCALNGCSAEVKRPAPKPTNRMEWEAAQEKAEQIKRLNENQKKRDKEAKRASFGMKNQFKGLFKQLSGR